MQKFLILFFLIFLFPNIMASGELSLKMQRFLQIKKIIMEIKGFDDEQIDKIANWILLYSDIYLITPDRYLYSVCLFKVESNFNNVLGDNGNAIGFGQVHIPTALKVCKYLGLNCSERMLRYRLLDPKFNIQISLAYLGILEKKFNDIEMAILSYNTGEIFVKQYKQKYNRIPQTSYWLKINQCIRQFGFKKKLNK